MEHLEPFSYTVLTQTPIIEALKTVNNPPLYTAFVIDSKNHLKGVLTDGDFRRGLLAGHDLSEAVDTFMKRDPTVALETITQKEAKEIFQKKSINFLPLLTQQGELKKILIADSFCPDAKGNKTAVIMAGGKGSRLYPLTKNCPKPMLKIDGKPILEILIKQCIEAGFGKFYISVNYLKNQIINYFGDGERIGASIEYLEEDCPLGTAGSLQLLPKSVVDPFLVLNGDLLTSFDYSHVMRFHAEHAPSATVCVREHITQIPFGVVQTDGHRLVGFKEKPTYRQFVNAGVYVVNPSILRHLEPNTALDMPSLLAHVQAAGSDVMVCPIHEYWLDIGRPEALNAAQQEWKHIYS